MNAKRDPENIHAKWDHRAALADASVSGSERSRPSFSVANQIVNLFQIRYSAARTHSHTGEARRRASFRLQRLRKLVSSQ